MKFTSYRHERVALPVYTDHAVLARTFYDDMSAGHMLDLAQTSPAMEAAFATTGVQNLFASRRRQSVQALLALPYTSRTAHLLVDTGLIPSAWRDIGLGAAHMRLLLSTNVLSALLDNAESGLPLNLAALARVAEEHLPVIARGYAELWADRAGAADVYASSSEFWMGDHITSEIVDLIRSGVLPRATLTALLRDSLSRPLLVELLLEHGADATVRDCPLTSRNTLLHRVCAHAKSDHLVELTQILLEHGLDINAQNEEGQTALHALVLRVLNRRFCNDAATEFLAYLLDHRADPSIADNEGATPLQYLPARTDADRILHVFKTMLDEALMLAE